MLLRQPVTDLTIITVHILESVQAYSACCLARHFYGQDHIFPVISHHGQPLLRITQGIGIREAIPQIGCHPGIVGMPYKGFGIVGMPGPEERLT